MVEREETDETNAIDGATGGRMLARRWTIAACFRDRADYGIPAPPTYHAERKEDRALVLSEDGELVMRTRETLTVRR